MDQAIAAMDQIMIDDGIRRSADDDAPGTRSSAVVLTIIIIVVQMRGARRFPA